MKKIYREFFALPFLLFISQSSFGFESYDFSPITVNENDNDDYNDSIQTARNDYYDSRFKKYKSYSIASKNNHYAGGGKTFIFDPRQLRWFAYFNGSLINSGRASGGRHYCPDIRRGCKTPVGVFRISHKGGPDCKSSKYPIGRGNAPMPWCMFFHGNYAIHGGQVPAYNASHGCIRVTPLDARWLSHNFLTAGTKVIVKSY
jgi:hypothetical protein